MPAERLKLAARTYFYSWGAPRHIDSDVEFDFPSHEFVAYWGGFRIGAGSFSVELDAATALPVRGSFRAGLPVKLPSLSRIKEAGILASDELEERALQVIWEAVPGAEVLLRERRVKWTPTTLLTEGQLPGYARQQAGESDKFVLTYTFSYRLLRMKIESYQAHLELDPGTGSLLDRQQSDLSLMPATLRSIMPPISLSGPLLLRSGRHWIPVTLVPIEAPRDPSLVSHPAILRKDDRISGTGRLYDGGFLLHSSRWYQIERS